VSIRIEECLWAIRAETTATLGGSVVASWGRAISMLLPHPSEAVPYSLELGDGRSLTLREVVGKGSVATVYKALLGLPNGIRRLVAVKLFSPVSSEEADQILALVRHTARRLACIDHPNVARVYDCGAFRGRPFIVSELVDGVSLAALQERYSARQQRLPLDLALFVACEVIEGLAGARMACDHEGLQIGVLHQGLMAREVLLSWRGEVKVSDFEANIARAATSGVRNLRGITGRAVAMAPEVAIGDEADARSDIFSFGVLLRELFIGPRFPPGLPNADSIRLARQGYVQPFTFQPHLPPGLIAVMARALEVDPEARYPNASVLAFDLRRVALSLGVGDGRYFLRSTLEREWAERVDETTEEQELLEEVAEDAEPYEVEPYEDDLLNRRR
jgi:serine/threonine-protein kinase